MAVKHHADIDGLSVVVECLVAFESCIRQILITYILAVDACLQTLVIESVDVVEYHIWRERQRGVAKILH